MALEFTAAVKGWAEKAEQTQTKVLHRSLRLLDGTLADATPVVTGNLRDSRAVSTLARPRIEWKTKRFRDPSDAINNAIAGVEIGQRVWLGYRAVYAYKAERKYGFARMSAQHWSSLVDQAARETAT